MKLKLKNKKHRKKFKKMVTEALHVVIDKTASANIDDAIKAFEKMDIHPNSTVTMTFPVELSIGSLQVFFEMSK